MVHRLRGTTCPVRTVRERSLKRQVTLVDGDSVSFSWFIYR